VSAKLVHLIESTDTTRGSGDGPDDPERIVTRWYTLDGEFVVEHDPFEKPAEER